MGSRRIRRRKITFATFSTRTSSIRRSGKYAAALALASLVWIGAAPQPALPSIDEILDRYVAATRLPDAIAISTLEIRGSVAGSGLTGSFHSWRAEERERDDNTLGARSERMIVDDGRATIEDENGFVRELRGVTARRQRTQRFIDDGEFLAHRESIRILGTAQVAGRQAYKLEVVAPEGEPETLYLDAASGIPLREEYIEGDGPMWVDLSDWHTVDGHLFPFHAVVSDGDHAFDFVQTTETVKINQPIPDQTFTRVAPRTLRLSAPVTVPISEAGSHYFCDVAVGTKSYRFLIDSGSSGVVLDRKIVREQSLKQDGALEVRGIARMGGLSIVRVANLRVGGASIDGIVAAALDLAPSSRGALRFDGILGYPLFAGALVKIDPDKHTMTLAAPDGFAPRGTRVDLELDRGLPEARVGVNSTYSAPFLIDTGNAGEVLLFRWFVDRNPGLRSPDGQSRSSYGIGGSASLSRTVLDEIDLGGIKLYQRDTGIVLETRGAFADRYDAGNIGLGVLRNFIMTFDEPHYALYLEPAASFADGRDRPSTRGNSLLNLPSVRGR